MLFSPAGAGVARACWRKDWFSEGIRPPNLSHKRCLRKVRNVILWGRLRRPQTPTIRDEVVIRQSLSMRVDMLDVEHIAHAHLPRRIRVILAGVAVRQGVDVFLGAVFGDM